MVVSGVDETTKERIELINFHDDSFEIENMVFGVSEDDQKKMREIKHILIDNGNGMGVFNYMNIRGKCGDTIASLAFRGNETRTGVNVHITVTVVKNVTAHDLRFV